jgi:hypothetical protein
MIWSHTAPSPGQEESGGGHKVKLAVDRERATQVRADERANHRAKAAHEYKQAAHSYDPVPESGCVRRWHRPGRGWHEPAKQRCDRGSPAWSGAGGREPLRCLQKKPSAASSFAGGSGQRVGRAPARSKKSLASRTPLVERMHPDLHGIGRPRVSSPIGRST